MIDDKKIVCWISSITPNISGVPSLVEIRVNPAKKDGTRSNRVFVLNGYNRENIKKID